MLQTNPHVDPIIEILRLAYRRGLALRQAQDVTLRQQQEQEKQTARPENFGEDTGQAEVKQPTPEGVNREQV